MSRLKYVYTPRRRVPAKPTGGRMPVGPLLVAPVLLMAVFGAWWAVRDGGGDKPLRQPAVLAASCAPGNNCAGPAAPTAAAGSATARPRRQLAPAAATDPPPITGISALVVEEPCGGTLFEQNASLKLPPASLTKIMTALVAVDHSSPDDLVKIDVNGPELSAETDSTVMGIEPGMTLSMRDLLYGLLLSSGHDAAVQIAEHVAGTVPAFVRMMNDKASAMGLRDTHFSNPHGLDDDNLYSSARDMALMGRELLKKPELAEIVRTQTYQPSWDKPALQNMNLLLGFYQGAIGVKTGYTDLAGQTIVGAAERDGRRIIVSEMGAKTDIYADASALLEWAFGEASACASSPTP
ncbi:MAG TPA: D-alanyl-D-alanine carboxypeptidase family protein [Dehalococcoidia bacterium]|nr:D-alanyl-D-alanine carboxypeptidase family protein [Dehalococcoidia bacterium]